MNIYHISSTRAPISFEFGFCPTTKQLRTFKVTGEMTTEQFDYLIQRFPAYESVMEKWKTLKAFKVVQESKPVSFDDFYEAYGNKTGKKAAQNSWKRMSKANQLLAFQYINRYKFKLNPGTALKYPATYLNGECWND